MMKVYDLVPRIGEELGTIDSVIDEQYPHIAEKINLFWGESELIEYLDNLTKYEPSPDRPDRKGFSFDVINELQIIIDTHHEQFPEIYSLIKTRLENPYR